MHTGRCESEAREHRHGLHPGLGRLSISWLVSQRHRGNRHQAMLSMLNVKVQGLQVDGKGICPLKWRNNLRTHMVEGKTWLLCAVLWPLWTVGHSLQEMNNIIKELKEKESPLCNSMFHRYVNTIQTRGNYHDGIVSLFQLYVKYSFEFTTPNSTILGTSGKSFGLKLSCYFFLNLYFFHINKSLYAQNEDIIHRNIGVQEKNEWYNIPRVLTLRWERQVILN